LPAWPEGPADVRPRSAGFGLRIGQNGSKVFLAQYSSPTGKRRVVIGPFGVLTPDEARKRARAILGSVAAGQDPFAEKRAAIAAKKVAETTEKARAAAEAYTVRKLVDGWLAGRDGDRRETYLAVAGAALKRHFAAWLDRPAAAVTTVEAVRELDRIKRDAGPVAANRALAYGRACYSWAEKRQLLTTNPFRGIEAPSREKSRDRVLSAEEIGAIWRAAGTLGEPYGRYVRTLLLTLQRREEVASMRWDELSADLTTWTLPANRAKNGKAHIVHLADPVREILRSRPGFRDIPFVFPSESGRPVSAFSMVKSRLDARITAEREEAAADPRVLSGWTMHDFRRAGVTALAGMGFPPHVCDKLLNHVSGSIRGVAAVYQRAEFLTERKAALDAWARHVLSTAKGVTASGNVVELSREAVA
jgi:integrase